MMVRGLDMQSGTCSFMKYSLIQTGSTDMLLSRADLMANPTPWMLSSAWDFPFQKNVYQPLSSFKEPSSANWVLLSSVMSTLYLFSSLLTSTILLLGLVVPALLSSVWTFHAPMMSFIHLVFWFVQPLKDVCQLQFAGQTL